MEVRYRRGVPPVVNDPVANAVLRNAVGSVLGPDAVIASRQSLGGEDFGWFGEKVPSAMARLGTRTPGGTTHDLHQPEFDVDELESRHDDALRFHRGLSLDVLPTIETPDVVLIDGDHNWYTVYHELKLLERTAAEAGHPMPVVVLHDVDWPYGRRDLYYTPETIPESYRQPYRRAGLVPGNAELQDDAGINRTLANALDEHGVRNGVRTGLEDFIAESSHGYRVVNVPGNHGVGILAATQRTRSGTRLGAVLDELESTDFLRAQCLRIEEARVTATIGLADAARAHATRSSRSTPVV